MGCDIHWVLERRKDDGSWLGVACDDYSDAKAGARWYWFFAELGMLERCDAVKAEPLRGVPDNASELSKYLVAIWGTDGHSHSWLPYADFYAAYERAVIRDGQKIDPDEPLRLFGAGVWIGSECSSLRVVFFFDN